MKRVGRYRTLLIMCLVEFAAFIYVKPKNLELFIGFWIFMHLSTALFGIFRLRSEVIVAGSADNLFGLYASEKIDHVSDKPKKRRSASFELTQSGLVLFVVHFLVYILFYVLQ